MKTLPRNYKVRAKTKEGDVLQISTESRERAIGYYGKLSWENNGYADVWVELGDKSFRLAELKELP